MKLKLILYFALSTGADNTTTAATPAAANTYTDATYGKIACGKCLDGAACDSANGDCPASHCEPNWEGSTCTEAICKHDCGSGMCVAPNMCRCAPLYTVKPTKDADDKIIKIECESQRMSGFLKGFFPTLLVLAICVITLKIMGMEYAKKHGPLNNSSKYAVAD